MRHAFSSKFEQRKEDQKKSLEQLRARIKKKRKEIKSKSEKKNSSASHEKNEDQVPSAVKVASSFDYTLEYADEREGGLLFKKPSSIFAALANKLHDIKLSKEIEVVLIWPAAPLVPPAVHSIASFAAYENGDKLGLRSLLYPAKNNAFYDLNHIRVDAKWLYEKAQYWQSLKRNNIDQYNSEVTTESDYKDILYYSLSDYIDSVDGANGYPSIGETLPTFPVGRDIWGDFTNRIFKGVFKHVSKAGHPVNGLGDPANAPDAIFGLHPDLSQTEILNRITSAALLANSGRCPDVAIIDLRRRQREWLGRAWINKTNRFLDLIQKNAPYSPVGALVIIDDPIEYEVFLSQIGGKKKNIKKAHTQSKVPIRSGVYICTDGAINSKAINENVPISHSRIHPQIVDFEVAVIAKEFYSICNRVRKFNQSLSDNLIDCAGYLLWAARLPCSQNTLQKTLNEDARSDQELQWQTENYTWRGYKSRLLSALDLGAAADELHNIQLVLLKADAQIDAYTEGTPSGKAVLRLVGEVLEATKDARSKKKRKPRPIVTISVSSALQARLMLSEIESHYQIYDDSGNELIQVVRTAELFSHSSPEIARRLIVIGTRARTLAELCAARELPKHIELVLSAGDAEKIIKTIKSVLRYGVYECFHDPLKKLEIELESSLQAAKFGFSILDEVLHWRPKPSADDSYSNLYGSDFLPPDIELDLDGAPPLGVYKSRPVFVYDGTKRPPFKQKMGKEIEVGDHVQVVSEEMRNEIEAYMNSEGRFKSENVVRKYHKHISDRLCKKYPNMTQVEMIAKIEKDILRKYPSMDAITESKIRYWITVDRELDLTIENLKSHAPRNRNEYLAFIEALDIEENVARLYWDFGIKSFRSERQQEGRRATWLYQRLLMDPDSVAGLLQIPSHIIDRLLAQARMNVFEVINIKVLK